MTTTGTIKHICLSESKGTIKHAVAKAVLREDHGLVGDAHAGPGHRQISILDETDINYMKAKGLELEPGAFGENLVIAGLDLALFGVGSKLKVGEALLEVTQIGKVCHTRCEIYNRVGECIMPRSGLFAIVIEGGQIQPGTVVSVEKRVARPAKEKRVDAGMAAVD